MFRYKHTIYPYQRSQFTLINAHSLVNLPLPEHKFTLNREHNLYTFTSAHTVPIQELTVYPYQSLQFILTRAHNLPFIPELTIYP
jgi:hypothetical protein